MKKRTKSIIGLSLATLACGAVAAVLPVASASAETAETGVFKIADGASIRYQSVEGRPEGLRFIALMSEDVKEALVGKNFGFIVSREDQFDNLEAATAEGATPDYLSMANKSTTEVAITAENIDEKIYEGEDEYAGYWCANIVINMNTQEGSSETEEAFMERAYSAVAYYENADGSNRVYTTNRQERSIQEVSSKLYLANDADWENVKDVYAVGTDNTPLLLAQNGKNAYSKLVDMVNAETVDNTLKFALAENVVVEELLPDTFTNMVATDKSAYDVESFYTVNHAVTDVYSTNKEISLTDKVSAVFGDVAYTVYNNKGVAVPVTENKFTANTAGVYTVTAARKDCPGKTFSVEVADNAYADGLILDGTSAEGLQVSATSKNAETGVWEDSTTVEMLTSFDESMKYDSESNGSYKIEYKMKDGVSAATGGALMKLAIAPTFSKAYYEGLKEAGYTNIAVRAFIEMDSATSDGSGLYYINTTQANSEKRDMKFYADNNTVVDKTSYIVWKYEFANSLNKWVEIVLDINKFTDEYASGYMNLLIWQVGANASVDMTVYVDNVYAVKQAETQEAVDYAEKNASVAVNDSAITTVSLNGEQIAPTITDNTFTATQSGTYKVKSTERNAYGCTIKTVHIFADDYTMGDIVAYDVSNFSAHNNKSNSSDFSCTQESDGIKVTANQAAQSATAPNVTTYKVNTLYDLSYYQWLKNQGYQYITYECRLDYDISYSTGSTLMCRWAYSSVAPTNYTNDSTTHGKSTFDQWYRESTSSTVTQNDSTNKKSSYRPWSADTQVKGKTFIISFSIDDYINTYSSTMNIASFYFNNAAKFDYSVTFGKIQATKEACKF